MSFGFSVGDLATVINLIDNIASSLQNNGGAKSEYQELLRTLECLRNALDDLDSLQSSEADSNTIDAVVYAALSCRHILETFRESIRGYDRTLGVWAKGRPVKSIVDKLRWTFQQRHRPSPLLTTLDIHIDVINILLAKHGQEKLDRISSKVEAHQSRIQETLEDTRVKIGEIGDSVKAQALAVQSNTSVLGKLHQIISDELSGPWRSVANLVAKLCVSTQEIYGILLEIKSSLSIDTRWEFFQAPYAIEDALGYRYPIPSEFDFDLIQNIIKSKFRRSPAYREVVLGNYELFNTRNSKQIISAHMLPPPGTPITMAILLNKLNIPSELCPIPSCRPSETLPAKGGGRNCCQCNIWYDSSTQNRRSFSDVIRRVDESEYQWLVDNMAKRSMPNFDIGVAEGAAHRIEDITLYKNVKLSKDIIGEDGEVLGDGPENGFCIFTANTQVTLADILRSYDRGELCVDDLRAQILQLFKGGDLSVRVEVIKDKIFAQALDTVAISISPQSLIPSGALLPEAEAHTK